jgi:hypothetical protein
VRERERMGESGRVGERDEETDWAAEKERRTKMGLERKNGRRAAVGRRQEAACFPALPIPWEVTTK